MKAGPVRAVKKEYDNLLGPFADWFDCWLFGALDEFEEGKEEGRKS